MNFFIVQDIHGFFKPTVDSECNFPHIFPPPPPSLGDHLPNLPGIPTSLLRKPLSWTEPAQGCLLMPNYHTLYQTVGSMV